MKYVIVFLVISFGFAALFGGYDDMNWDELIPLFKIGIPYLFIIGFPVILTLTVLFTVKVGDTGTTIAKNLFRKR